MSLAQTLEEARGCRLCAAHLPLGPRPVLRASVTARLLIIGQAPGTKVHESGIPWNDASGARLREWLQMAPEIFYDESRVARVPLGFCYPGRDAKGGDKPPRPECAPTWHPRVMGALPNIDLTLLVGSYAQARYLPQTAKMTMTARVAAWRDFGPAAIPLPHPSWRNTAWLKRNPWFAEDLLPELRARVADLLSESAAA